MTEDLKSTGKTAASGAGLSWLKRRPLRYLLVGGWNTLFGYLAYTGLYFLLTPHGVHYVIVAIPAHVLAVCNAYLGYRFIVFKGNTEHLGAFFRFNLIYWVSFCINLAALPAIVNLFGVHPLVAQVILTVIHVAWTYFAHARFGFRVGLGEQG